MRTLATACPKHSRSSSRHSKSGSATGDRGVIPAHRPSLFKGRVDLLGPAGFGRTADRLDDLHDVGRMRARAPVRTPSLQCGSKLTKPYDVVCPASQWPSILDYLV